MSSRDLVVAAAGASAPSDPYFEYNTLLLTGDGTNGAQNNTFLDSSTNNFTITRNGNTTQGTFSPYGSLWSNYFDGSGDYLSRAFTSTTDGMYLQGSTYTIEAWVYMTSTSGIQEIYCCSAANVSSFGAVSLYVNSGVLGFSTRPTTGGGESGTTGGTVVANTWNHVAASVSSGSAKLFLNGGQVGSTTTISAATFTPVGAAIGRIPNGFTTGVTDFTGYISNLRIVQGQALYTSNFTPSTTPLTAVSGTSLLTCQSNRFIDNSSNNFTLTVNGNTSVQRFSPFNPTAPYDAATIGGSGYFDGTGDYVTAPASSAFQPGTGDFSSECWFNCQTTAITGLIGHNYGGAGSTYVIITLNRNNESNTAGYVQATLSDSSTGVQSTTSVFTNNTWNHVVCCRTGTTFSLFLNGIRLGTTTNSTNVATNIQFEVGNTSALNRPFSGYVSNARFIKGSGPYDATQTTCTVPTAPLTAITNTSLLLNFTNAGIPDAAMMNDLETVGNAQVSTSVKKYGTGSLYFDGSGDCLTLPTSPNQTFGTGDFTIEGWFYVTSTLPSYGATLYAQTTSGTNYLWCILGDNQATPSNKVSMLFATSGTGTIVSSGATTFNLNTWNHFAIVRSNGSAKVYLNGVGGNAVTCTQDFNNTTYIPTIGRYSHAAANFFNGYIDDLRITKGYARYTANFTPPAQALPTN